MLRILSRRSLVLSMASVTVAGVLPGTATAALFPDRRVLLMIEELGCPYCARWKRDVEQAYRNSLEGRVAPLEIIMMSDPRVRALKAVVYSPTFILLDHGQEVGRIIGYTSADFFWGEIENLFARSGFRRQ